MQSDLVYKKILVAKIIAIIIEAFITRDNKMILDQPINTIESIN